MGKHNSGLKFELQAQKVLSTLFPDEFGGLEISDRPDLIDEGKRIGVEVVVPCDPEIEEAFAIFKKEFDGKDLSQISLNKQKKFQSHGYALWPQDGKGKVQGVSFINGYIFNEKQNLLDALILKNEKLNMNLYRFPDDLCLYLETSRFLFEYKYDIMAVCLLDFYRILSFGYRYKYKELFYDNTVSLYRCNLEEKRVTRYDIEVLYRNNKEEDL